MEILITNKIKTFFINYMKNVELLQEYTDCYPKDDPDVISQKEYVSRLRDTLTTMNLDDEFWIWYICELKGKDYSLK